MRNKTLPFLKPQISIFSKCLPWSKRGEHSYLCRDQKAEKQLRSFLQSHFIGSTGKKPRGGQTRVLQYICIRQLLLSPPNLHTATKIIPHLQEKQPGIHILLHLHSPHTAFQLWRLRFKFGTSYRLKEFDTVSLISKACLFHMLKASNSLLQLATVAKKSRQSITL